jgi:hypothetical protein
VSRADEKPSSKDPAPVKPAAETVEKIPFQKPILEKWGRNIEKHLVFCAPNRIWAFFSQLWKIFVKNFQIKGFSTVTLGCSWHK